MENKFKGYVVKARVFYSYFPTTLTLLRALCRLKHNLEGLDINLKEATIAGPYVYKKNEDKKSIYALGGSRLRALKIFNYEVGYVPFESDRPPFYTIDEEKKKVFVEYPVIPSLLSRVNITRDSFTSTGTGRVAYIRNYYLGEDYYLLIVADGIDKKVIELLGRLGLGRYKTVGGGMFEIKEEVDVMFNDVKTEREEFIYTLTTLDTTYKSSVIGEVAYYLTHHRRGERIRPMRIPYYPGGIIVGKGELKDEKKLDPGWPQEEELLPEDCRPNNRPLGFPKIVKRSARAPFIIFIQTRGGSSSR